MREISILEKMAQAPIVFDGAMGTVLYAKGVFVNRCFDEVCLKDPDLVREVHRAYIKAGADAIETNTFGANRIKLSDYGLADSAEKIVREAVRLAREAADEAKGPSSAYIVGAAGPCLRPGQLLTPRNAVEVRDAFAESIGALAESGVDCILLETFSDANEANLAIEVATETGLPLLVSFAVGASGNTAHGTRVEDLVSALDADGRVGAIGLNCGTGPAQLYDALERALPLTSKPMFAMPNAGLPRDVDGRVLYLVNDEYFTSYAKRFIKLGVRGIGGCCGTTPEHIAMAAKAVHALSGVKKHIEIQVYEHEDVEVEMVPFAEKTRVAGKLARGEKVTTIEVLPPRSTDLTDMLDKVRRCYLAGVDAINIPDGPRASARISPMVAALTIRQQIGIEPILHYCCRDRNLIGMQSDLMGGYAAGVRNFLIVTGDPPKLGDYPDVTGVFDVDSIGLTQVASNLNRGRDIGGNPVKPPTGILIGVGVNPAAVEMRRELERFRLKIEAGAEYAITQPIFDAEALLAFLDRLATFPRQIPIIAGIWPLTSLKNAEFMRNEVPGIEIPDEVVERMRLCKTREEGLQMGVQIAREIRDAIAPRVAGFQVSAPFGKVELAFEVLS